MMGANKFELPPSVAAYVTDAATKAGVDALWLVEEDALPPELEWGELDDYFAAQAAAGLTVTEFVRVIYRLWRTIWAPAITTDWALPGLEEQEEAEMAVTQSSCWSEKSFFAFHYQGKRTLYTLVELDRREVTIAFSLEERDKPILKFGVEGFRWRDDKDWHGWLMYGPGVPVQDGKIDCTRLKAAAKAAMKTVNGIGSDEGP